MYFAKAGTGKKKVGREGKSGIRYAGSLGMLSDAHIGLM
jgi:hypothetical protein